MIDPSHKEGIKWWMIYLSLIDNCCTFHDTELRRHNDAEHPINILVFLIDNDFINDDRLYKLNKSIVDNDFSVNINIPVSFGGTGKSVSTWIVCDLP